MVEKSKLTTDVQAFFNIDLIVNNPSIRISIIDKIHEMLSHLKIYISMS